MMENLNHSDISMSQLPDDPFYLDLKWWQIIPAVLILAILPLMVFWNEKIRRFK